jgi:MerR family transcriptional regulator, light-induced transcriptional regulator
VGTLDEVPLDLRSAAAKLGVHYQTAYGWVRSGRLKAVLVDGRYLVAPDDIASIGRERRAPSNPTRPTAARLVRASDRMHDALVSGSEPDARRLAMSLVDEGTSVTDLIQMVFVPPLVRIGDAWHDGDVTVWVEHRASAIVERILGELAPNPRGRRRGTALVVAVAGDLHSLPTSMAAMTLRDDNWNVEHLGANLPPEEIGAYCAEHPVTVAVITSTNPGTADLANETATALRTSGTPAIVGGPGRTLDELLRLARQASLDARTDR